MSEYIMPNKVKTYQFKYFEFEMIKNLLWFLIKIYPLLSYFKPKKILCKKPDYDHPSH